MEWAIDDGFFMPKIDLRWGQDDPAPYLVPIARIPCVGERLVGPDEVGELIVTEVIYVYESGFYYPPNRVEVRIEPE